jgi:hypothetical protein
MPENARDKGGNADILTLSAGSLQKITAERQFGDVELVIAERAKENFLRLERKIIDPTSLDLNTAVFYGTRAIIVAAGDCEVKLLGHVGSLPQRRWQYTDYSPTAKDVRHAISPYLPFAPDFSTATGRVADLSGAETAPAALTETAR